MDDTSAKAVALSHITRHLPAETKNAANIFCPLAGDDSFVKYAFDEGHSVSALDLVPAAVAEMRRQFGSDDDCWTKEDGRSENMVVWRHASGRATLYEGDAFTNVSELRQSFDAVYDKDSFGALDLHMRSKFCERISDYLKDGALVYTEVKNKDDGHPGRNAGPPFHVEKEDLMALENFGNNFEHVDALGEVYPIGIPQMRQTGHVLKRKPRK